ncbi:MAG: methyltransferase domain-containing protein [Candidatus Andersenbacteria bacterium]
MPWVLLLVVFALVLLIPTAYAGYIGAPYAPTRIAVVKKAFDFIDLGADDTLIDLGAGDGKIVREAAARGAKAIGFELSPIMWVIAWLRTRRYPQAHIRYRNFYKQPLEEATVIFAFLMPKHMPEIRELLKQKPLSRAKFCLAYAFPFPDVVPFTVIQAPQCAPLYVYAMKDVASPNNVPHHSSNE